jgi:hypothetical protein
MTFYNTHIEYPEAYASAVKANIIANAQKTWRKNNADTCEAIEQFLDSGYSHQTARGDWVYTDNFVGSLAKAFDTYGKLSEKQCVAVLKMIAKADERRVAYTAAIEEQKARSVHLGVASERVQLKLHVDKIVEVEVERFSYYDSSTMYIYLMRDEAGNRIVYKTKAVLGLNVKGDDFSEFFPVLEKGDIELKATVKAHAEYKGEKQTIIQRAKVLSIAVKETEEA